jgi:hypothetical protein
MAIKQSQQRIGHVLIVVHNENTGAVRHGKRSYVRAASIVDADIPKGLGQCAQATVVRTFNYRKPQIVLIGGSPKRGSQILWPSSSIFRASKKTALARELEGESFGTRATDAPRISGGYAWHPDCGERAARSQWFKGTDAGSRPVRRRTTNRRSRRSSAVLHAERTADRLRRFLETVAPHDRAAELEERGFGADAFGGEKNARPVASISMLVTPWPFARRGREPLGRAPRPSPFRDRVSSR